MKTRIVSLVLMATGVITCCGTQERPCKSMGCADGIGVQFPGLPNGKYTIDVVADGKKSRHTCEASPREELRGPGTVGIRGGPCGIRIDGKPQSVKITLRGTKVPTHTRSFRPVYKDYRPNGAHCEPVCRGAKIVFE